MRAWFAVACALLLLGLLVACSSVTNMNAAVNESCVTGATCGAATAAGAIETCITRDGAGACTGMTYRLTTGKSYVCKSCTDCDQAVADVTALCGPGTGISSVDGGCTGSACAGGDGGPAVVGQCKAGGGACANGTDCCSNRCVAGVCDPCAGAGDSCESAACCTNGASHLSCYQNACSTCLGGGAPCKSTTDCCSQACTGGTCEAPQACRADGASCAKPADCCGASGCNDKVCGCNVKSALPAKIPAVPPACVTAIQASCCTQASACLGDPACVTLVNCVIPCGPSDLACRATCASGVPSASVTTAQTLAACLNTNGATTCVP